MQIILKSSFIDYEDIEDPIKAHLMEAVEIVLK